MKVGRIYCIRSLVTVATCGILLIARVNASLGEEPPMPGVANPKPPGPIKPAEGPNLPAIEIGRAHV